MSVRFSDEQGGSKAIWSSYLARQNCMASIENIETEISININP